MEQDHNIPRWFLIVGIIALIWNMLGFMAFISHIMQTPEMIAELPEPQQALYASTPSWATFAFAVAVIGGILGCMFMLLKKPIAKPLFIASLMGVLVQNYHSFFVIDSIAVYGSASVVMPILVATIALVLIVLSMQAQKSGWIE